jgi:hypothetical protein
MDGRWPISPLFNIRSRESANLTGKLPSDWALAKWEGTKFFRSSFVYGFRCEPSRQLNWGALLGLALSIGISASFWSAAALVFARLAK